MFLQTCEICGQIVWRRRRRTDYRSLCTCKLTIIRPIKNELSGGPIISRSRDRCPGKLKLFLFVFFFFLKRDNPMLLIGRAQLPRQHRRRINFSKQATPSFCVTRRLPFPVTRAKVDEMHFHGLSASFVLRAACCASHKAARKLISRMLPNVTVAPMFLLAVYSSKAPVAMATEFAVSLFRLLLINAFRNHQSASFICCSTTQ